MIFIWGVSGVPLNRDLVTLCSKHTKNGGRKERAESGDDTTSSSVRFSTCTRFGSPSGLESQSLSSVLGVTSGKLGSPRWY